MGGMGDIWTALGKALDRQAATQASIDAVEVKAAEERSRSRESSDHRMPLLEGGGWAAMVLEVIPRKRATPEEGEEREAREEEEGREAGRKETRLLQRKDGKPKHEVQGRGKAEPWKEGRKVKKGR